MTLTLPRRFLPFLFALAVSIALALSACQLLRENPHSFGAAFTALFAIVLALVALWWALRQARYMLRPESLHLDRHGLHIRHHAVAWRTLHLRPADILELRHDGATLTLNWRDSETTHHATLHLRLQRACYSDVSGKTRRGQAAVALLVARLGQQLPSPAAPARPSQPFHYQWQFARNNSDSDDIGRMLIVFAFPLLALCAWLAVFLNSALQRANVPGSMLITTAVTLLGLCVLTATVSITKTAAKPCAFPGRTSASWKPDKTRRKTAAGAAPCISTGKRTPKPPLFAITASTPAARPNPRATAAT